MMGNLWRIATERLNTLRYRIILLFIAMMIPLIIFLAYSNLYAMNVTRHQVAELNSDILKLYVNQINIKLTEVQKYLNQMAYEEPDIGKMVYQVENNLHDVLALTRISDKIQRDVNNYNAVDTYFIYLKNNDQMILATKKDYFTRSKYLKDIRPTIKENKDRISNWEIVSIDDDYYLMKYLENNLDIYIGALIDINTIIEPLAFMNKDKDSGILVLSQNGDILAKSSVNPTVANTIKKSGSSIEEDYAKIYHRIDHTKYVINHDKIDSANISIVAIRKETDVLKKIVNIQRTIYFIPIIAIIVLIAFSFFIKTLLLKPIKLLIKGMNDFSNGNHYVVINQVDSEEFNILISGFNKMVTKIKKLTLDVYEQELRTKNAELKNLQSQINPHFFMNSLNIIYNLAALKKYSLVQKMALNLSNYSRYMMYSNREKTSLKDVLEHIKNYLDIHKIRFEGEFDYTILCPSQYLDITLPPLIIQPFVENAIIHGFKKKSQFFRISIVINDMCDEEHYLVIKVEDNGCGLTQEKLDELNWKNLKRETGDQNLGIWNVCNRLKMTYGSKTQFSIQNGAESGVVVTIKIPMI